MTSKSLKSYFKLQYDEEDINHEEELEEILEVQPEEIYEINTMEPAPRSDERALNKSEVSVRLSCLGKIASGDAYAYLKATCTEMGLTDIKAILNFKHLQFVNVSNNKLTLEDIQVLTKLPYILLIHADKNRILSAGLRKTKFLQVIIMNNNNIKTCEDVYQPHLSTLELGYNKISEVKFERPMPEIKCLDFRYNIVKDIKNWDFPNLAHLYLAGNKIKDLEGIEKLTKLRILHLRNNPIKTLDHLHENMKLLHYINLRNCKVNSLKQVKKLKVLPALTTVVLKGTPYMGGTGTEGDAGQEEDDTVRVEMVAALPRITKINKTLVSDEEKDAGKEMMMQWFMEGEADEEQEEEESENEQQEIENE